MAEARIALAVAMLVGATVLDLRSRRVANAYWLPFAVAAAAVWAGDWRDGVARPAAALWALATMGALWLMWRLGSFGGADAKGLMVLAWLWPGNPGMAALGDDRTTPALDTLVNGTTFVLVVPAVFLAINGLRAVASGSLAHVRLPAALLGVRMDLQKARRRHVWPLQEVVPRTEEDARGGSTSDGTNGEADAAPVQPTPEGDRETVARGDGRAGGVARRGADGAGAVAPGAAQPGLAPPSGAAAHARRAWRWRYLHRPGADVQEQFVQLDAAGLRDVWVTPKLPFMAYLLAGLAASITFGNVLLWLMGRIM